MDGQTLVIVRLIKIAIVALGIGVIGISFWFFRNKKKEVLLGVLSFIFSILIAEVFLKLFYPQIAEQDKLFEYDPYLGWSFIPNHKGNIVFRGEARHYIRTNSLGFRDNPPPSDKDKIRKILVLGDSFVTNIAVRDDEVFTEVMERQLKNTAVLNFGVNGYGQVQEYLLLKQWLDKINPDFIIEFIYIRNDFEDNMDGLLHARPFASWDEAHSTLTINPPLVVPPTRTPGPFWTFYRRSHLYHLLNRELMALTIKLSQISITDHKPSPSTPPELYLCRLDMSDRTKLMYLTMEELLLRIASYAEEREVPLVFAIAPSMVQVEETLWSSVLLEAGENPENYVRSLPNDKLMQFAEKHNLLMVDLLAILQAETKKGQTLYNREEQHWSSDGNRVVAHSLLAYLKTKSLIE